jgi:endonuclease/exonuclease/phosphatase (EEP) superfamily protein YafD
MDPSPWFPRGLIRLVVWGLLITAPWLWFAVRDASPNMDTVAVALPVVGLGLLVGLGIVAAASRRWLPLLVGVSAFLVAVVATVAPRLPHPSAAPRYPITIAMANVFDGNPTPAAAVTAMYGRDVDLLVPVEMSPGFRAGFVPTPGFPYRVVHHELGVASRWPITLLAPHGLPRSRMLRVGVDAPGTPFILYVVHALNPLHDFSTFADQRAFLQSLLASAGTEQRPVVIVGDLNTSDRVDGYRILSGAMRDAMRAGSVPGSTYEGGWWATLFLRIDHAFIPPDWCAVDPNTFSVPGSDHHGIQVTVGPCA